MSKQPATVSFSVDSDLKKDLDKLSIKQGRSKSDLFREMYNYYRFKSSLARIQEQGVLIAQKLGLETDDDVYKYLAKNRAAKNGF